MNVEILIPEVKKLTTKTKVEDGELVTVFQFEARVRVASLARLLNLQRQGVPLTASIESPQAAMDLDFSEVPRKRSEAAGAE
jgi:hypothetical protein